MSDLFRVSREQATEVVELSLPSMLDSAEFDQLNEAMLALFGGRPEGRWVLDVSSISYAGSALLGLMVNIRQKIKQSGGRLVLCGLSPRLLQIFQTCSLERFFTITRNRQDAIEALQ